MNPLVTAGSRVGLSDMVDWRWFSCPFGGFSLSSPAADGRKARTGGLVLLAAARIDAVDAWYSRSRYETAVILVDWSEVRLDPFEAGAYLHPSIYVRFVGRYGEFHLLLVIIR